MSQWYDDLSENHVLVDEWVGAWGAQDVILAHLSSKWDNRKSEYFRQSLINNTEDVLVSIKFKLGNIDVDLITPFQVNDLVTDIGQVLIDTAKILLDFQIDFQGIEIMKINLGSINAARKSSMNSIPHVVSLKQHILCHIKLK